MITINYCVSNTHYSRFDILKLDETSVTLIAYSLYEYLKLFNFGVTKTKFEKFIAIVKNNYTKTSYHNFYHAIDVVCSTIYLLKKIKNKFSEIENIGIVLGALLHDIGHYGKTGKYVSMYDKEKYEKFGKNSTLEKYHYDLGILIIDKIGLFDNLLHGQILTIKNVIKSVILSTDPTIKLISLKTKPIYNLIIRCADISSVQKIFKIHKKWCDKLMEEFYLEGNELKTKFKIQTIDAIFDSTQKKHINKQQEEFYKFYVEPHFEMLKPYIYNYNEIWNRIKTNKECWMNLKNN